MPPEQPDLPGMFRWDEVVPISPAREVLGWQYLSLGTVTNASRSSQTADPAEFFRMWISEGVVPGQSDGTPFVGHQSSNAEGIDRGGW